MNLSLLVVRKKTPPPVLKNRGWSFFRMIGQPVSVSYCPRFKPPLTGDVFVGAVQERHNLRPGAGVIGTKGGGGGPGSDALCHGPLHRVVVIGAAEKFGDSAAEKMEPTPGTKRWTCCMKGAAETMRQEKPPPSGAGRAFSELVGVS